MIRAIHELDDMCASVETFDAASFGAAISAADSETLAMLTHTACWKNNHQALSQLLAAGVDPNSVEPGTVDYCPQSAAHMACLHRSYRCVAALLDAGVTPNLRTVQGYTLTHVVCQNDSHRILGWLIGADADLTAATCTGDTLLDFATRSKSEKCHRLLLDAFFRAAPAHMPRPPAATPLGLPTAAVGEIMRYAYG